MIPALACLAANSKSAMDANGPHIPILTKKRTFSTKTVQNNIAKFHISDHTSDNLDLTDENTLCTCHTDVYTLLLTL